jgi:hypothetical protein
VGGPARVKDIYLHLLENAFDMMRLYPFFLRANELITRWTPAVFQIQATQWIGHPFKYFNFATSMFNLEVLTLKFFREKKLCVLCTHVNHKIKSL